MTSMQCNIMEVMRGNGVSTNGVSTSALGGAVRKGTVVLACFLARKQMRSVSAT